MKTLDSLDDVPGLLDELAVPGLSVAFVAGTPAEIVSHAWGDASLAGPVTATTETLFRAGSISKVVTAMAVHRLAAAGRLDLDVDVNALLRSWQVPAIGDWQPSVTARMLLAHMAGTSGWGDNVGYADREPPPTLVDVLEGRGDSPALTFHMLPNVMWHYSSGGYHVLQQAVCDVTGSTFHEAVDALVFSPLGMASSTFASPLEDLRRPMAAAGHADGQVMSTPWVRDPAVAAGGMWTTPTDLMRLAGAINARTEPEMLVGHPLEPRMGLGLFLNADTGVDWWSHGGSGLGFECVIAGVADAGFAVAAMTNGSAGAAAAMEVVRFVSTAHGPGPAALRHLTWEGIGAAIRMNAYNKQAVGTYRLPGGLLVSLTSTPPDRWGQSGIELALPGQRPVQLLPVTDGQWRVPGLESYVTFEQPGTPRFIQGGREVLAERVAQDGG